MIEFLIGVICGSALTYGAGVVCWMHKAEKEHEKIMMMREIQGRIDKAIREAKNGGN